MKFNDLTKYDSEIIKAGYVLEDEDYKCIICGRKYNADEIFPLDEKFCNAKKMMEIHITNEHDGIVSYLTSLDKKQTGLSEGQKAFIEKSLEGLSDKEIARQLGNSPSTVRYHRYMLRERAKQAKLFLALYDLVEDALDPKTNEKHVVHDNANMIDERFFFTEDDIQNVIKNNLVSADPLVIKNFPAKEKKKLIILRLLSDKFEMGKEYTEKEVNGILEESFHDFATLRRYLIEYGILQRTKDCSRYWLKQ